MINREVRENMKKFLSLILLFILSFSLIGCFNFEINNPKDLFPDNSSGDVPTSLILTSQNNVYKLYEGETLQLIATVIPETVTEKVKYTSSDITIATVDDNGLVTGVSPGTVKITATVSKRIAFNNVVSVSGTVILTVLEKQVAYESVEIKGPDSVYVDDVVKFDLIKTPSNANIEGTWSVNNPKYATIDQNGRLIAKVAGDVVITYQVSDELKVSKTIHILNRSNAPESIKIVVRELIQVGESVQAFIETTPQGRLTTVEWSTSDQSIATVSKDGIITGVSEGVVTINAKYNDNIKTSIEIQVVDYRISKNSLEDTLVDLVRTRKGSVLGVSNYVKNNKTFVRASIGSGFVYKVLFVLKDGSVLDSINQVRTFKEVEYFKYYVITNRHVVEDADALKVYLHEEDLEVNANLIQYDDKEDVAVVTFNYDRYIRPLEFANSDKLAAGMFAVAIGNPNGYEFAASATFGIISHPKRYLPTDTDNDNVNDWDAEYIQHDVAINPGNSGGPLFNLDGEVIGINTLKYVSSDIENMGFSIPSNVVKKLIPYLENGERPIRARLGITTIAVKDILTNPDSGYTVPEEITTGLYVIEVTKGSVAEIGGLKPHDIIIKFNDVVIKDTTMLRAELNQIIVGLNAKIEVVIYRNNQYLTLTLTF